jgi:chitinase
MSFLLASRARRCLNVVALPAFGVMLSVACAPESGTDDVGGPSGTGGVSGLGDHNGDKVADGLGVTLDVNGDSLPDHVDVNGDGILDGMGIDTNGDNIADGVGIDTNGDGIYDAVDTNGDGVPDITVGGTGGGAATGGSNGTGGGIAEVGGTVTGGSPGTGGAGTGGATTVSPIASIVTESLFNEMFPNRNDDKCSKFFTYQSFIEATKMFPAFGTTGDDATRRREIAAFFGNAGHETTGGWADAPGGPYAWGLCFKEEVNCASGGCSQYSQGEGCVDGKWYHGRGPIQLSYCYNYGPAGVAIGEPLLAQPELMTMDPLIAFEASLWFWMHGQSGGDTSPHQEIVSGQGFGETIRTINGSECNGAGSDPRVLDRIGYFDRFVTMLGTTAGPGNKGC